MCIALSAMVGVTTAVMIGGLAGTYGPSTGSWMDAALWAISFGWVGLAISGALAVAAFAFGRGVAIAVAAPLVVVVVLIATTGMAATGAEERFATAPKAPECTSDGLAQTPEIQQAFDEFTYTGRQVDTLMTGITSCGVALRDLDLDDAAQSFAEQAEELGWRVVSSGDDQVIASRGDLILSMVRCDPDLWMQIDVGEPSQIGCPN